MRNNMKPCKMVYVPHRSFQFCKVVTAACCWAAVIFQFKPLIIFVCIIMLLSMVLKIQNAPFVWIHKMTLNKLYPNDLELVDENAVLFAHKVGFIMTLIASLLLYFVGNKWIGWSFTAFVAIMKTSGAFGRCGALKLYSCLNNPNGQCCRVGKKIKSCQVK